MTVTSEFREQLLEALADPEVSNLIHQYSDFLDTPNGLHHRLGTRHDQSSYGDHNHDGISSAILSSGYVDLTTNQTVGGTKSFTSPVILTGQTFPNLEFAPGTGAVKAQIIASTGTLNFDIPTGNNFQFRNGINGSAVVTIDTSGDVTTTGFILSSGALAELRFTDRDGIGGDYFSFYASSGGASLWSSVLGGNTFTWFENGNASTIGSHFFQSTSYGGRFGAGNTSGATSLVQIAFGYNGVQDSYRHEVKTMHDGGAGQAVNNRVSIWIWRPGIDATTADPSLKVAEFDGTGNMTLAGTILTGSGSPSFAGVTTATSAAAGSASALPSPPVGYWVVTLNGTNRKIPYYG